jgi:cell division protein ZapA (FtsZ GTPase activity inhibitor)
MPEELIPVNIVIGDRTYRIKVKTTDEEQVRKAVKLINEEIIQYKTNFAGKDMQDYIAMVTIWYATQTQANAGTALEIDDIKAALGDIEKLM